MSPFDIIQMTPFERELLSRLSVLIGAAYGFMILGAIGLAVLILR